MGTNFTQGYLTGKSRYTKDIHKLFLKETYDLAIIASSWDRRCLCITEHNNFSSQCGILMLFETTDSIGLREKHDPLLTEYLNSHCESVETIKGFSVDVDNIWSQLITAVTGLYNKLGHPLNIFLDLSSCPRYYALAIVGTCFKLGIAEKFYILYAEGIYTEASTDVRHKKGTIFTKGHWQLTNIPNMEGSCNPGKDKYFLVSVGFEGSKTLQVISKEDPDRISVLFPNPGFMDEYVERAKKENEKLIQTYRVPESQIIKVHAGDAIGVWKQLSYSDVERPKRENTNYLCCGTKPHTIGLCLRALMLEYPVVLYRIPEEHHVLDISPAGIYWSYEIKDISSLPTQSK